MKYLSYVCRGSFKKKARQAKLKLYQRGGDNWISLGIRFRHPTARISKGCGGEIQPLRAVRQSKIIDPSLFHLNGRLVLMTHVFLEEGLTGSAPFLSSEEIALFLQMWEIPSKALRQWKDPCYWWAKDWNSQNLKFKPLPDFFEEAAQI